ncbi:MAG: YidC/Oxa1 family membrane protein insertase [Phycisphaerales bacterium]
MAATFYSFVRSTRAALGGVVSSATVFGLVVLFGAMLPTGDAQAATALASVDSVWLSVQDQDASASASDAQAAEPEVTQEDTPEAEETPAVVAKYTAREVEPRDGGFDPVGVLDDSSLRIEIEFSSLGAGIESLRLPDRFETVERKVPVTLQRTIKLENSTIQAVPFAAMTVEINGETVKLSGWAYPVWSQVDVGVFEAFVDDLDGNPIARIQRRFTVKPDHEQGFYLEETIENLSSEPIRARLISSGMVDIPKAESSYGGDRRRVRYGYLLPEPQQGNSLKVTVDDQLKNRRVLLGKKVAGQYGKAYAGTLTVWPNEDVLPGATRLSWLAFSDRYFVVGIHPPIDINSIQAPEDKLLTDIDRIDRMMLDSYAGAMDAQLALRLVGKEHEIGAGESHRSVLGVYAGMRNTKEMLAEPDIAALNMPEMVISNLGGMCAPCTFHWLTDILIGVLRTFHAIVGDWAISILLLVIVVRGCLHPVTRWSQIRVQRFSVQMQAMGPKQKALKEKYKDDPKKLQAEMGKLWREEGISPAGMLGCLPMFLQSPVWIALYATLFFATELRQEPAFYGVFQNVFGWGFMSDLSAPDHAIPLPASMHFSFPMWGSVASINVLPMLLGVVFYLHQKYLTPPTQATMTPEQESQQKMMKVMMVFLFPVMMYAAPSGLALYFITNSTLGIIENKWIRAHMKKHGMLEIENIRAQRKDKGPGFLQRMTEAAEAQKQIKEKGIAPPNPASKQNRRGKM